ncbi:MAG: chemotaxis protein CheW [Dissulfuribacterales bacterium]
MGMEQDILKDFLSEAKENLELLDQQFVELEQDPENAELIKSIFRTIHTIKGTSGFFGFTTLEAIAHFAEDILSKLRDGVIKVTEDIATMLLKAVDYIKAIVASLEQTGKEPTDLVYLDFVVDLRNFAEKVTKGLPAAASSKSTPPPKAAEAAPAPKPESKPEEATSETPSAETPVAEALQPQAEQAASPEHKTPEPPAPSEAKQTPAGPPPAAPQMTETHVRVDVQLLDNLMNLAGELVLSRNRMAQLAGYINNPELMAANQHMSLIVTELQEQIMKTRMQPIGNVFNKFPRIVRDLAKNAQKQVQLHIEGAETELDRSIIEVIKDPLTHMVRNSIDHGIEAPDMRVQKDKDPMGTLTMRAYHEGGQVIIEIEDDGAGIDPNKIRKKAVEKGILTAEQAAALSDRDALLLIFQPGFSTAEKVTNISGRGVGMDVVKTNIEKIGGTVELQSTVNVGSVVKIKIPLTLAIIPALIVKCANERYAIPQVNLVELVHLSQDAVSRDVQLIGNAEFYRLRGQILPLVRLRDVLNLPAMTEENAEGLEIVVLNSGERQFGLVVDNINDSEEIVVKPLGRHLKHLRCYAGTTLMGDGRAALILDIVGIASMLHLKADEALKKAKAATTVATGEEEKQFLLLFTVAQDEYFAIPLALVNRLDKITTNQLEHVAGKEVVQYRNRSMPIIRLENYLPIAPLPEQDEYNLLVFHVNGRDIAFLVSKIEDSINITVNVEEENFKQEGMIGSAIIKDRTTIFLDVYQIIRTYDPNFFAKVAESETMAAQVLLAEDSNFYRNILSSYLTAAGLNVTAVEDGQQAWDTLQNEHFDLVITDIEMPNMTGLELTRKIKDNPATKDLPVIAVTSLSGEEDRKRGIQAGVDDYQPKLDRDLVLKAVERLLKIRLQNAA